MFSFEFLFILIIKENILIKYLRNALVIEGDGKRDEWVLFFGSLWIKGIRGIVYWL